MGVDDQLAGGIAVVKGAVLGASWGAFVRQRPDATAEYFQLAILVDHEGQQLVDGVAVELRHGFGDRPLLGLYTRQLGLDDITDLRALIDQVALIGRSQAGSDEQVDADRRQHGDQQDESNEGGGVASLYCF